MLRDEIRTPPAARPFELDLKPTWSQDKVEFELSGRQRESSEQSAEIASRLAAARRCLARRIEVLERATLNDPHRLAHASEVTGADLDLGCVPSHDGGDQYGRQGRAHSLDGDLMIQGGPGFVLRGRDAGLEAPTGVTC